MPLRTAKSGNVMVMWSEASHRHGYRLDFGVQNYCFFLYPANIFRYFFHFARFFLLFPTFQRRQNVYSEERIRTFGTTHTDVRKKAYELLTATIRTFNCYHTNFRLLPYELSTATIRSRLAVSKTTTKSLWRHNIDCLEPRTRAFGTATHYNRHPTTRHCPASDTKTPII